METITNSKKYRTVFNKTAATLTKRFWSLFKMRISGMEMVRITGICNKKKNDRSKNGLKNSTRVFSLRIGGQVIDKVFILLILFILPQIAEGINYHSNDSEMRTGNKRSADMPFQVFPFQNSSQKTRP